MPPAKKRKTRASARAEAEAEAEVNEPQEPAPTPADATPADAAPQPSPTTATTPTEASAPTEATTPTTATAPTDPSPSRAAAAAKALERQERFRALQARAKTSAQTNMKEAAQEAQRQGTDPALLASLNRKHATASQKLLKADAEAAGEDFERKRAWDWTVEESERWDKRLRKKGAHRDDQAFQDYRQDSRKVYKRQIGNLAADVAGYERAKTEAVQRAAASGGLEIVETEDGELVAVDKDGSFYSTADSTGFVENRPEKAAVDRLVKDLQQAEDARLKKRKERGQDRDEGDVTYINEKNKNFNQKLARFYNKYTAEIRDSFERGTMI